MNIAAQARLRKSFNLEGADDLYDMLVSYCDESEDLRERNDRISLLAGIAEEQAIPFLKQGIEQENLRAIHPLSRIRGKEVADILFSLLENTEYHETVRNNLPWEPRRELKQVYLRVSEDSYNMQSIIAVQEYSWLEALPLLQELEKMPHRISDHVMCMVTQRELRGNPLPPELLLAEKAIGENSRWRGEQLPPVEFERAMNVIIAHPDTEASVLIALRLPHRNIRMRASPVYSYSGVELLGWLPNEAVIPVLEHLLESSPDATYREQTTNLLELIGDLPEVRIRATVRPR